MMVFHLFSCIWIILGGLEGGWRNRENLSEDLETDIYISAIYFVTTTATTIGYGDYVGTIIEEKIFILFLEFAGICVFSTITGSIKSIKAGTKLGEAISERKTNLKDFINDIDQVLPIALPENIYDAAVDYIDQSFKYGVVQSFMLNVNYQNLSVSLKDKLVFVVL